jgi:hypothetical protein
MTATIHKVKSLNPDDKKTLACRQKVTGLTLIEFIFIVIFIICNFK